MCTATTRGGLAGARVLASSIREHHSDVRMWALVLDATDGFRRDWAAFDELLPSDLGLDSDEFCHMALMYDEEELCRALQPWLLRSILERGTSEVVYLDPDMQVFAPLDDVAELARAHAVVVTPYVLESNPASRTASASREVPVRGIYDPGLLAVGQGARGFLDSWTAHLRQGRVKSPADIDFAVQGGVDRACGPSHPHVLRDPTVNVAYWNLATRGLSWTGARYEVGGKPLRVFHFSGFDPGRPYLLSREQGDSPQILLSERPAVARICRSYAVRLLRAGHGFAGGTGYRYGQLPSSQPIDRRIRSLYRRELLAAQAEGKRAPPNPFGGASTRDFLVWLHPRLPEEPIAAASVGLLDTPHRCPSAGEGINVVGYFGSVLGLGEAARLMLAAIKMSGIPHAICTARVPRPEHRFEPGKQEVARYDINLLCVNANELPALVQTGGRELLDARYNIGLWFWETENPREDMIPSFDYVDEVWVASDHTRRAMERIGTKPVFTAPLPVEPPVPTAGRTREDFGLPAGFMFLFCFDFLSIAERKNPLGLIEAFRSVFSPGSGAVLVIKSINGHLVLNDLEHMRIEASAHPDIAIIDRSLPRGDTAALMALCDCYVSLHRAEGFGLTLAEAMALGKPVIATGYSGNLSFMTETNSYLVPYRMVPIGPGNWPYEPFDRWAEPDIAAAGRLMRYVFEQQHEARARGLRAREDIATMLSPRVAASFIATRLASIRRMQQGAAQSPAAASGRGNAMPHRPAGIQPAAR